MIHDTIRTTLEDAGVTPRQWRILAALHAAPATVDELDASRPERPGAPFLRGGRRGHRFGPFARDGFRPGHPRRPTAEILGGHAGRGWVERDPNGAWRLTATGSAEHDRVLAAVTAAKESAREGISDEDWATAMSVLRRVAENTRR